MKEKQELHCHNCGMYVRFGLDLSIDDQYVLICPECGHKHYRIVKNGKITDVRWGQDPSQDNWYKVTATSVSYISYLSALATSGTDCFYGQAWANTGA
jgi:hypothetical protein